MSPRFNTLTRIDTVRRRNLQAETAAATFNPFDTATYGTFAHMLWAGDPNWSNPGDGVAVSSWRNGGSVGGNPAQAGAGKPVYRATVAGLNSRPALEFTAASSQYLDVDVADIAQTFTILYVAKHKSTAAAQRVVGRGASAASQGVGVSSATQWQQFWGVSQVTGTADTNAHLFRFVAAGASSIIAVDQATLSTANASTGGLSRLTIGAGYDGAATFGNYTDAYLAFVAIVAGNPDTSALETALRTHYGI